METFITVKELLKSRGKIFGLKLYTGKENLSRKITVSEINRPGLAVTGYLEQYRAERIQVIGHGEYTYCNTQNYNYIKKNLDRMLNNPLTP